MKKNILYGENKMGKKLLVLGSAGFLGSNFIRYILYRSKEYNIISVDGLFYKNDHKRLYLNKKHKFYLGDLRDINFLNKILKIEEPDIIINTINCNGALSQYDKIDAVKIFSNILSFKLPIIQIISSYHLDTYGIWDFLRSNRLRVKTILQNNLIIEIPNCFGTRQRCNLNYSSGFLPIYLKKMMLKEILCVSSKQAPWINADDLASFIWFAIENKLNGFIKMPETGKISIKEMLLKASKIYNLEVNIKDTDNYSIDYIYKGDNIKEWIPDMSINDSLNNTINWYKANNWALNI